MRILFDLLKHFRCSHYKLKIYESSRVYTSLTHLIKKGEN